MRSALLLLGSVVSASAMGCAVSPTTDTPDAEATAQAATAVVVVERAIGPGDATREAVVARFVRTRQGVVDEQALRMAGVAHDLPTPGTCTTAVDDGASVVSARPLELLDVGPLGVEGPQARAVLLPRAMPDPAGVLSGVFYSSRSAEALAPGARLALRAAGGPDLEAFAVSVSAPSDVADVHVASQPQGLDVSWDATDADARDVVYLDVLAPAPLLAARCTALDTGRFVVPAAFVAGIEDGQLGVHRVRREPFRVKGVDPGEVRFDIARVVVFRR